MFCGQFSACLTVSLLMKIQFLSIFYKDISFYKDLTQPSCFRLSTRQSLKQHFLDPNPAMSVMEVAIPILTHHCRAQIGELQNIFVKVNFRYKNKIAKKTRSKNSMKFLRKKSVKKMTPYKIQDLGCQIPYKMVAKSPFCAAPG